MSLSLVVGLVLLVLVGGLALWQRRTRSVSPAQASASAPARQVPDGPVRVKGELLIDDPALGVLTFNESARWVGDSLPFAGRPVLLELTGDVDGPSPRARALVTAALAQPDLDARGRTLVRAELARRGLDTEDVEPYEIAVDVEDGVATGYIWYAVETFDGEIGVAGTDEWRTLSLEVIE